ncbi:MAG TPA: GAF domain-containing protein [Candidatus Eremiobacteraceae bacterium]|nr:GAF domain-containing protein [Candidatus Eremiobacteraceae bacterium]
MSGERERSDLVRECCAIIARTRKYALVSVCRGEPDGRVSFVGSAGDAQAYLYGIDLRWDDRPEGGGPIGRAIRRGEPGIAKVSQASFSPWRDRARQFGIRCVVALPISGPRDGRYALAAYSTDARQVWGHDLTLLKRLAADVALAL